MSERNARDWFAVQLEVTQRLLSAETQRIELLGKNKANPQLNELVGIHRHNHERLKHQTEQLSRAYEEAANFLRNTSTRVRSLPAIGIKGTSKKRSELFSLGYPKDGKPEEVDKEESTTSTSGTTTAGRRASSTQKSLSFEESAITFQGIQVASGTLDALMTLLTPTVEHTPDKHFTFTFILTSRLIIQPHELLSRLVTSCRESLSKLPPKSSDSVTLAGKFCRILQGWVESFPYDYREERMMIPFKEITQCCALVDSTSKSMVVDIQRSLIKKLNDLDQFEATIKGYDEAQAIGEKQDQKSTLLDVCDDALEVAKQLTLLDQEHFRIIGTEEFLQSFVKVDEETINIKDFKRTNNLETYVQLFNRLSYLVATEILVSKKKERAKAVEFFIEVAKHLSSMSNYNSLMAVIAALNLNPIARLRKTWSKVNSKLINDLEQLEALMDPSHNFKSYRQAILERVQTQPAIFFFSLIVKDIYFTNEALKNTLPSGHINFDKMWTLSQPLSELQLVKVISYDYPKVAPLQQYIRTCKVLSELDLFKLSVAEEEPPKEEKSRTMQRLKQMESQSSLSKSESSN